MSEAGILLIDCADRKWIVPTVADFLYSHGANILHADQHQDRELGMFFMRVEWAMEDFDLPAEAFATYFQPVADRFQMRWRVEYSSVRPAVAIFVSRCQHCLMDLLHRHQIGELPCQIPLIVSNHPDAHSLAEFHRIPFHHVPVDASTKPEAEQQQLQRICLPPPGACGSGLVRPAEDFAGQICGLGLP